MANMFPTRPDSMLPDDRFFRGMFGDFFPQVTHPRVDIQEKEDHYQIEADLPGMNKEDIEISYHDNVLTLSAETHQETEEKDDEKNYIRRERTHRSFRRQFILDNVEEEGIKAKYEDGVLNIQLPKRAQAEPEKDHRITIE